MFKKSIFSAAVMCVACCIGNQLLAQKGGLELDKAYLECQYHFSYLTDTLKPAERKEDRMLLLVGSQASLFHSYRTFLADSVLQADKKAGVSQAQMLANVEKYKGGESEIIYKYDGKVVLIDKIFRDYFRIEEPQPTFEWVMAQGEAEILGYPCKKATCFFRGRHYVAWFTLDIPMSNGPWKFSGLPGLIVKIADMENHYQWELVGVKKLYGMSIVEEQRQCIQTSRAKFAKTKQRAKEDMLGYMMASGVKVTVNGPDGKPMSPSGLKKAKVTVVSEGSVSETGGTGGYDPIERI